MWCPAGHQAKEVSCQANHLATVQARSWTGHGLKETSLETGAGRWGSNICRSCLSRGGSCTSGVPWSHRRVSSLWAGAAGTSVEPWESSAAGLGLALQGKVYRAPLTAQNLSLCFSWYKTTSGGRAWAGLYSQDLHLMPGVPSCTEDHPGWEWNHMSRQGWRGGVLTERSRDF